MYQLLISYGIRSVLQTKSGPGGGGGEEGG